uniref:Uncharacterized protein n=1 Tax=Pithovirus LCDPAC02 TaxID=2506601 RepID=A0A481YPD1_9VIRU|nr:MAG: hypothetical protein LCDPAC02_03720 [Pithovirus LCDPAC02]
MFWLFGIIEDYHFLDDTIEVLSLFKCKNKKELELKKEEYNKLEYYSIIFKVLELNDDFKYYKVKLIYDDEWIIKDIFFSNDKTEEGFKEYDECFNSTRIWKDQNCPTYSPDLISETDENLFISIEELKEMTLEDLRDYFYIDF